MGSARGRPGRSRLYGRLRYTLPDPFIARGGPASVPPVPQETP